MKNIEDTQILCIGDIMLDKYVLGDITRISPEAPVPIVEVKNEYTTLGGCGNVVNNIAHLGAKVRCIAKIGKDKAGEEIKRKLESLNVSYNFIESDIPTIQKERIIASERLIQILRIDREEIVYTPDVLHEEILMGILMGISNDIDIIVISDYAKGMITKNLMAYLKELKIRIIVDPKPSNFFLYNDVYIITPNQKEYLEMSKINVEHLKNCSKYILKTMGKDGMILYNHITNKSYKIKSTPVDVYNVSGAGDTVVAIMAICLGMGYDPIMSSQIANICAGYVVTQPGTSVVDKEIFKEIINN